MINELEEHVGKYAIKKRGFYGGLIGIIKKTDGLTGYSMVFADGSACAISRLEQIKIIQNTKGD